MIADEIAEICLADHNQSGSVRQIGMIGGKRVFQPVFAGQQRERHYGSRQGVGECNTGTGFQIGTVLHGTRQVLGEVADCLVCVHIAGEIGTGCDESLHAVEQGIETLKGRKSRRHGKHQLRIDDGEGGKKRRVHDKCLFIGFLFGNDAAAVRFRSRAGGGRNGDDGQQAVLYRLSLAGAYSYIIP